MKRLKQQIKNNNVVEVKPDTVNAEGAPAWTKSDKELLDQLAMCGTLGNTFYAKPHEIVDSALALLERAEPQDIADAIVKGREEGFIRAFPILALVTLSKRDPQLFKETFQKVIRTGNDLGDFIDLCRSSRGMGRAVKSAIRAWIATKLNPYYAQKYRKQIADAVRLVRYKGVDPLFGYVLAKYGTNVSGWTTEKLDAAYAAYPQLQAHRDFVDAVQNGYVDRACELLDNNDIDVDSLTTYYSLFHERVWKLIAKKSPVMRFLKYLDKFDREGVFDSKENLDLVRQKLTVENLKSAKVFPFRLYTAAENISNEQVREILYRTLDSYVTNYDWGALNQFSWAVCPDVSGSMNARCGGSESMRYIDIAGMFVAFFRKGLDCCSVYPWDTQVLAWTAPTGDTVYSQMQRLGNMLRGGTDMSCALRHMIANDIKRDCLVFITDTEEYGGRLHGNNHDITQFTWLGAWSTYKKTVNKDAIAFVLREDCYETSPVSERDAEKYDVYPIYGWNDNVLKYIQYVVERRANGIK